MRKILAGIVAALVLILMFSVIPAFAGPPSPATEPIDDPAGNPNAPGVNVIRKVSNDVVLVRLNKQDANGGRQANFNVIVRGVEVESIEDIFPDPNEAHGVDGPHEDGIWGVCGNDELLTDFGSATIVKAKFTTCGYHDSFRLHLGETKIGKGSYPAIKVVFTEGVLVNTQGVFVGVDGTTDWGNSWIPLYESPPE